MQKITENSRNKKTLPKPPDKQGVHLVLEPPGASPASTQVSPQSQGATPISLHWAAPPPHLPDRALGILTVKELPLHLLALGHAPSPPPRQPPGGPHCQGLQVLSPSQWMESMPIRPQGSACRLNHADDRTPNTTLVSPYSGFPLTLLTAAFRGKDSSSQGAKERRRKRKRRG